MGQFVKRIHGRQVVWHKAEQQKILADVQIESGKAAIRFEERGEKAMTIAKM